MANKTVYLVNVHPFAYRAPNEPAASFVFERELVRETEHGYIATSDCPGFNATYLRQDYLLFDARDEALIHLERIVLDKMQELEDELSKWHQFTRSIEVEIMKP